MTFLVHVHITKHMHECTVAFFQSFYMSTTHETSTASMCQKGYSPCAQENQSYTVSHSASPLSCESSARISAVLDMSTLCIHVDNYSMISCLHGCQMKQMVLDTIPPHRKYWRLINPIPTNLLNYIAYVFRKTTKVKWIVSASCFLMGIISRKCCTDILSLSNQQMTQSFSNVMMSVYSYIRL